MIIIPQGASWTAYALVTSSLTILTLIVAFKSKYLMGVIVLAAQDFQELIRHQT